MVKKLNLIATTIKTLLENKVRTINIPRKLKISKQRANYWMKVLLKSPNLEEKISTKIYIDKVISLGENKTTSFMNSRKIADTMNLEFQKMEILTSLSERYS